MPSKKQYSAIAWLFFALGMGGASWASRIVTVHASLHISHVTLGLVLLASACGALVAFTSSSRLLAHCNQAKLTVFAAAVFYTTLAVAGLCTNACLLAGVLFIMGASAGFMNVSMNLYAVRREQRLHTPLLAKMHGFCSLGALVGAVVGQAAAGSAYTLFAHLAAVGLVLALGTCRVGLALFDADREYDLAASKRAVPAVTRSAAAPGRLGLFRLGAAVACASVCEGTFSGWTGVYLHQGLGLTPGHAARGYVVFTLAMVCTRLGVERLSRSVSARRLVMGGSGVMVAGVVTTVGTANVWLVFVGVALCGIGLAGTVPLAYREAARRRPQATQSALATMTQCTYVGALLGPPLVGFAAEVMSLRLALSSMAILAMAIAWAARDLPYGMMYSTASSSGPWVAARSRKTAA